MARNKRWKRQAKKLLGECINHSKELCENCRAIKLCNKAFEYTGYVPMEFGIRILEERCKYCNITNDERERDLK